MLNIKLIEIKQKNFKYTVIAWSNFKFGVVLQSLIMDTIIKVFDKKIYIFFVYFRFINLISKKLTKKVTYIFCLKINFNYV
jgi:hypothetical protein